jgi:hypothetical protein
MRKIRKHEAMKKASNKLEVENEVIDFEQMELCEFLRPILQPEHLQESSMYDVMENMSIGSSGQYHKLFTAVITPLAAYFSMILTELCR